MATTNDGGDDEDDNDDEGRADGGGRNFARNFAHLPVFVMTISVP